MALKHVMINDIISEHSARMNNLKKYYPFFVLSETTFSQYKEGKYSFLDMGYITMASLRFFINENNFHEKNITYEEYEDFLLELLRRDFNLKETQEEEKHLALFVFDKLKNDGRAFEFRFFDPESHSHKVARVRLIDSRLENGHVYYSITPEAIEFYLDTKEVKDESRINVAQLLLEKMISSNNFKGGIDVVRRINSQVTQLILEKEKVLKLLGIDVFEGVKAYETYMATTAGWFSEEQKLFAKNKALVEKAIEKASGENSKEKNSLRSKALEEVSTLETELKRTIYNHSRLISETAELTRVSDNIIARAKLKKLRPVFDFEQYLTDIMKKDSPGLMEEIIMPLLAPKIYRSFSMKSIDNLLTLKGEDRTKGERLEKQVLDPDFMYDDEILDKRMGSNFARLFYELLDQINKWGKISLQEFNGILEIKFGEEIFANRDYYSFLVHLAGKRQYSVKEMIDKQDTLLEEMVVQNMDSQELERFANVEFVIEFGHEDIEIESCIAPENKDKESFKITNMLFERRLGS